MMPIPMRYKPLAATASILSLCACEAPADPTTETAVEEQSDGAEQESQTPSELPDLVESAWLTVGVDGAVQTTFLDAEGRYRDQRNGERIAAGGWEERPEGTVCFEPDTGRGACWTLSAGAEDSTLIATNDQDKRVELTRIAYEPPEDRETAAESE